MRNLINPTLVDLGTLAVRGQDWHIQRIRYGTHYAVHVFRKGELHRHGLVFQTEAQYEAWKRQLGSQSDLFGETSHR